MSWIDETLAPVRRRLVSHLIEFTANEAFHRTWQQLTEVERHAIMAHIADEDMLGTDVSLEHLSFRCHLCEAHTVRYVHWAPLQCTACRNTYTWTELDPTAVELA